MDSLRHEYASKDICTASTSTAAQKKGNTRKAGEFLSDTNKRHKPEIYTNLEPRKRPRTTSDENKPEDSDSRKKTNADHQNQPGSGPSQQSSDIHALEESRIASKLLAAQHGVFYQVEWMMVVALETKRLRKAPSKNHRSVSGFKFRTEVEDAGKFDDVVWQYKDGDQEKYNFLQAKHSLKADKRITIEELLKPKQKFKISSNRLPSESNKTDTRPFALKKYFISYRDKIKEKYRNEKQVENLIIATNIDLDDNLKNIFEKPKRKISVLELRDSDAQNKGYEYWKLNKCKDKEGICRIVEDLEGSYDLIQLGKRLAEYVLNNEPILLSKDDILNPYSEELRRIFQENKFRDNFVTGHKLSDQIKNLREAFLKEGFSNRRKSVNTDYEIKNPIPLAKIMARVLNSAIVNKYSVIKIERRAKVIRNDIDKLAGYVLIKKNDNVQFNPKFLTARDEDLPNLSIQLFRKKLMNLINGTVNELGEFKFNIVGFKTCEEMLVNENAFWEGVKNFSQFQPENSINEETDYEINHPVSLAMLMAKKLKNVIINESSAITIERRGDVIKSNIDKLAGSVLIEKNGDIQFNPKFLRASNEELANDSVKVFRKELIANIKNKETVDKLGKLKFKIKNFKTCKVTPSKDLPRYSLNDIKKDIEDFFNKLVFAVKYSKESLSNVTVHEFGTNVGLLENDFFTACAFRVKIAEALDLTQDKFISTDKDVDDFFVHAKQQINRLILIGPTAEYRAKMEKYGINFEQSAVDELELGDFLKSQSNIQIFNVIAEQNELSSIKVYQILRQIPEYRSDGSYIFLHLSAYFHIQDRVVQALNSKTSNLLIIAECNSADNQVENIYEKLKADLNKQIKNKSRKMIVLITNQGGALADKFKTDFSGVYKEKFDKRNSIIDLTDDSQQALLEKGKVMFQGEEAHLGTLIDDKIKYLIDAELLSKLINNEKIEIGKALQDLGDIEGYYISRILSRQVKIKEGFKQEASKFFVTHNNEVTESNLQQDQDIVLISDTGAGFEKLCNKHKQHNIHWMKEESNEFIWQRSHGDTLTKIRGCVLPPSYRGRSNIQDITSITDKVVIVAAEPGMGKSTILTNLALTKRKNDPSSWIVRINLVDHSTELSKQKGKKTEFDEIEAIKFLYRTGGFQLFEGNTEDEIEDVLSSIKSKTDKICIENNRGKGLKSLEIEIFLDFYNQGKIALLFDGFDEISPDYKEEVIELLKVLKGTKVERVWVTTRPYGILNKLEDALSVFSYSLEPFSRADQQTFLEQFWKNSLEDNEFDNAISKIFIDELLDKFSESTNDEERRFVSIPLLIKMIAKIFEGQFKIFCDSNEQTLSHKQRQNLIEKLNLATMYDDFFKIMFDEVYLKEKRPGTYADRDKVDTKSTINRIRQESIQKHRKLALYALFGEDGVNKLLPGELKSNGKNKDTCIEDIIKSIELGKEKTGIIDRIVDNKPIFVHKTFAEYFAAHFFAWRWSERNKRPIVEFLTAHILEEKNKVIRNFFDYMLVKDEQGQNRYEIHVAVLNNDQIKVKNLTRNEENVNSTDKAGRTPLHLAAGYGYEEIAKILLQKLRTNPQHKSQKQPRKDWLFSWSPLRYADKDSYWNIAELLLQEGANGKDMPGAIGTISNGDRGKKLLHTAAKEGYLEFAKVLVGNNADINAVGEDQRTPLHFAAQKNRLNVVKYFVDDLKVDVNITDARGKTPLQLAVEEHSLDVVKYFGDDTNVDLEIKLLYLAAKMGSLAVLKYFVGNKNVDVNIKDEHDVTPLHWAAANGHLETVQYLVGNGAHLYITNKYGYTPLHFAASCGYLNIVKYLWTTYEPRMNKCKRDFTVGDGSTLLHLAAKHGHLDIVKYLTNEKHVKLNSVDNNGRTPLDIADRYGKLNVVEFLIENGGEVVCVKRRHSI